jgi:putative ABC transport system substrate-binding protein
MRRREFIALIGGAVLAMPIASLAQQPRRIARIGWLATGSPTSFRFSLAAFREGLTALGYKEGQNLTIEYRWADGNVSRLPILAAELVEQGVDVILAGGNVGAEAAKKATREIPIVAAGAGDLVESGLVTSLARPGGNLTGFIAGAPEAAVKRVEIIREIKPLAKNIAVVWNPASHYTHLEWKTVQETSKSLGLSLVSHEARVLEELETALVVIPRTHPDFILVFNDPFVFTYRKRIADAAAQDKLLATYGFREFVDDGGLISYGSSITDAYRRAATYVDKILKGSRPDDLPIQLPTKFELVINLKTAKALGLAIPPSLRRTRAPRASSVRARRAPGY